MREYTGLVSMGIALGYFFITPDYPAALVVLIFACVYCFERLEVYLKQKDENRLYDANIVAIQNQLDEMKRTHDQIMKAAEDTKKLLSQANLARGLSQNKGKLS